jgi:branched-chain amino acid aminotransferase
MRRPIWFDGAIVTPEEASVSVLAHAAHRGSLVFDVGAFHATPRGVAVFRLHDHLARFRRSAGILGLEIGHDAAALAEATRQAVSASGLTEGLVRWSALVSTIEPDLLPRAGSTRVAIAAYVPADLLAEGEVAPPKREALRIAWFEDARKAPPEVLPPLAKVAGAYVGPLIAKRRAVAAGADEVVLLDANGDIAEAPTANVFAVSGGELVTPPLGGILDGITRDTVLAVARAEGIVAHERALSTASLAAADEAFLTASSFPIVPIASVNGVPIGREAPGPLTRRLKAIVMAAERGADPRFLAYTT